MRLSVVNSLTNDGLNPTDLETYISKAVFKGDCQDSTSQVHEKYRARERAGHTREGDSRDSLCREQPCSRPIFFMRLLAGYGFHVYLPNGKVHGNRILNCEIFKYRNYEGIMGDFLTKV